MNKNKPKTLYLSEKAINTLINFSKETGISQSKIVDNALKNYSDKYKEILMDMNNKTNKD